MYLFIIKYYILIIIFHAMADKKFYTTLCKMSNKTLKTNNITVRYIFKIC